MLIHNDNTLSNISSNNLSDSPGSDLGNDVHDEVFYSALDDHGLHQAEMEMYEQPSSKST
jgi:hypothetical protein